MTARKRNSPTTRLADLRSHVEENLARYERRYGFTRTNGYAQVEGRGERINRFYGEYDAFLDILDELEGN